MKKRWNRAFSTLMCWLYAIAYPAPASPAAPAGVRSAVGNLPAEECAAAQRPLAGSNPLAGSYPLAGWQAPTGRLAVFAALVMMPEVASAGFFSSGSGTLPWMQPLSAIASSLDGPVARVGVLIAIAFFGLLMMFGELKGIFGTAARILFGASLALGAVQWAGVLNFGSGSTSSFIHNGTP